MCVIRTKYPLALFNPENFVTKINERRINVDSLLADEDDLSSWRGEAVSAVESIFSFGNTSWHLGFRERFVWESSWDLVILKETREGQGHGTNVVRLAIGGGRIREAANAIDEKFKENMISKLYYSPLLYIYI